MRREAGADRWRAAGGARLVLGCLIAGLGWAGVCCATFSGAGPQPARQRMSARPMVSLAALCRE